MAGPLYYTQRPDFKIKYYSLALAVQILHEKSGLAFDQDCFDLLMSRAMTRRGKGYRT
jgi:hypothetical protein